MNMTAEIFTATALGLYALGGLFYGILWLTPRGPFRHLATLFLVAGLGTNLVQLVVRWVEANQPPFKTLFESLVLLAFCMAFVYLVVELVYKARLMGLPSALGCVATMLYAFLRHDKEVVSLPPALQSFWFIPHVVIYFFGYASLFLGGAVSFLYLLRPKIITVKRSDLLGRKEIDLVALLDGSVLFGFALLTVGLVIGAAWAKDAWGDYWVWDPKETWSLVSWLIFAAYLHLRFLGAWRGRRLAVVVLIGIVAVLFTYLGMNLLPSAAQSAHVYQ